MLPVPLDVGERRQRVPDVRCPRRQGSVGAVRITAVAVGLTSRLHVIGPAHAVLVKQVGDVRPGVVVRASGHLVDLGLTTHDLRLAAAGGLLERAASLLGRGAGSQPGPVLE